jgi:hypothetical protein
MNIRQNSSNFIILGGTSPYSFNLDLGAGGGTNIIQSICLAPETSSASNVTTTFSTSPDGIITNTFWCQTTASPETIQIYRSGVVGQSGQIISTDRYLNINFSATTWVPDQYTIYVSYFQIPAGNLLASNFRNSVGVSNQPSIVLLNGPATGTYNIKSIYLAVPTVSVGNTYSIQLLAGIFLNVCTSRTLSASAYPFLTNDTHNISLSNGERLQVSVTGPGVFPNCYYYCSYTYNPLDV